MILDFARPPYYHIPGDSESNPCAICKRQAQIYYVLNLIFDYGGIDGEHHKQWVLDQVIRTLTGDKYELWVKEHNDGSHGPNTYSWDKGVAP
jgi:hypothetical protein